MLELVRLHHCSSDQSIITLYRKIAWQFMKTLILAGGKGTRFSEEARNKT